ncbi:hypothetical protein KM043_004988 [Ampulex compressa]|nr:hypothetical protein KM043_004988 [Ampulex compressa]
MLGTNEPAVYRKHVEVPSGSFKCHGTDVGSHLLYWKSGKDYNEEPFESTFLRSSWKELTLRERVTREALTTTLEDFDETEEDGSSIPQTSIVVILLVDF